MEYVGSFMGEAQEVLRGCGFLYFTLFRGREPVFVRLE